MNYKNIIWYLLIFLFVIFGFRFVCYSSLHGLDPSWIYALNNIHINGDYIFGRDVFFTFGPFGYLLVPFCFEQTMWQGLLFNICIIAAFVFALFSFKDKENANIFLGLLTLIFVCLGTGMYETLAVLLALVCLYKKSAVRYTGLILLNLFAFFMLFAKFNIGVACIATLVFTLIAAKLDKKLVLISFLFWGIALSLITYFYFGNFETLAKWFSVSLNVASGYSEAMLLWKYTAERIYFFTGLIIVTLYFWLWYNDLKNNAKYSKVFFVILPSMFFVFKSGFVRLHLMHFFPYVLAVIAILYFFVNNVSKKTLAFMCILAVIYPFQHISTGCILSDILRLNDYFIYVSNEYILPDEWIDDIKNSTVEFLPYDFSYIQKNNLKPQYNPILQLYSVYTQKLDLLSAESYKKQKADFIIVDNADSIDKRKVIFDNPATWDAIRENYYVKDFKNNKIFLARRNEKASYEYKTYEKGTYNINENIIVPKDAKKAVINLDLSIYGTGANFLLKILPLYMYVTFNNDKEIKIRVVRDVMKSGIYIDEGVFSIRDFNKWLKGEKVDKDINSIRFYSALPVLYKKDFSIEWQK